MPRDLVRGPPESVVVTDATIGVRTPPGDERTVGNEWSTPAWRPLAMAAEIALEQQACRLPEQVVIPATPPAIHIAAAWRTHREPACASAHGAPLIAQVDTRPVEGLDFQTPMKRMFFQTGAVGVDLTTTRTARNKIDCQIYIWLHCTHLLRVCGSQLP